MHHAMLEGVLEPESCLANAICAGVLNVCFGSRNVATETRGDSLSGQSTALFSTGIKWGSVCSCRRMSSSTSSCESDATIAFAERLTGV